MPRPTFIKDLIDDQVNGDITMSVFGRVADSAIPYVIQIQEVAGIDMVSDGEWRRKSYIGIVADICDGFELTTREFNGERQTWHTVTSPIKPVRPGQLSREARFLKQHTSKQVKVALPSPYLIAERMWDPEISTTAYPLKRDFAEALVPVLRKELELLRAEGIDTVQFDDPHICLFVDETMRAKYDDPEEEVQYAISLLNKTVSGFEDLHLALHLCRRNKGRKGWVGEGGYEPILPALSKLRFNMLMLEFSIPVAGDKRVLADLPKHFDIGLGCVDCRSPNIDTPNEIVDRVEQALKYVSPDRVYLHPDCGFAPGSAVDIPLDEAYLKLRNEALAAATLRHRYQ